MEGENSIPMNQLPPSENSGRQMNLTDLAIIAGALAIYIGAAWSLNGWIIDDAGITFAYARSLAFGHGLVAQPGMPPVEGYSNFLWLLITVPFFWLRLFDPFVTSKLLSFALVGLTFLYLYRITLRLSGGSRPAGIVTLALTALNASFVIWTCSGLENPLFAALIAVLVWRLLRAPEEMWLTSSAVAIGLLVGGIALTRPDGVVYAAMIPLALVVGRKQWAGQAAPVLKTLALSLGVFAAVYGGYVLFRYWYFDAWLPNTYYAKGGPEARFLIPALTLTEDYGDKFRLLFGSLFGNRVWLFVPVGLIAGATLCFARRGWSRSLTILAAVAFIAYFVHMIMPRDWMGEFRFATPFFVMLYALIAVVAVKLLRLIDSKGRRVTAGVLLATAAIASAANTHIPRLQKFYDGPPASFASVAESFAFKFDAWAEHLGLDSASVLLPDVGAPLYYSNFRVYDLGRLTDRAIARTLYKDNVAFHNYVFNVIRPTFIHTHGSWTNRARLDEDARFRQQYVAIKEYPDGWVKSFNGRDMMSGDYVRKDAVAGRAHLVEQLENWQSPARTDARTASFLTLTDAIRKPQGFVELAGPSLPNTNVNVDYARAYHGTLDADSIEMIEYGGDRHYQPVEMAHRCYHFMGAYLVTKDPQLLDRTAKYIRKMASLADTIDDALFIPYSFDKRVHRHDKTVLRAPWYSGMAQGEALAVTMRLWELTGNDEFRRFGDRLFNSLVRTPADGDPWVSRVDSNGYFWIEEYPSQESPGMTLNGFIAAVYGVYDYYRLTRTDSAKALYEACLTTLRHYLPEFRRPADYSYYCLGHQQPANETYHHLHISMLNHLSRMTGEAEFRETAEEFLSDSGPRGTGR